MRKLLVLLLLLLVIAGSYFGYIHFTAADLPTFGLTLSGEKGKVKNTTKKFLESIEFKNVDAIKSFINSEVSVPDVDNFLNKTFDMPYDTVDLEKFSVEAIEMDSSNTRSKVRIRIMGNNQASKESFNKSKVLYWYFQPDMRTWLIDIKNLSL